MDIAKAIKAWNLRNGWIKFEGSGARKKQEQHPVKWETAPPMSDFIVVSKGKYELKPLAAADAVAEEMAPVAPSSVMEMPEMDGEAGRPAVVAAAAMAAPPLAAAEVDEDEDVGDEDLIAFTYQLKPYWRGEMTNMVYTRLLNDGVGQQVGEYNPRTEKVNFDYVLESVAEGDYMPSVLEEDEDTDIDRDYKLFVMPNRFGGPPTKYWKTTSGRVFRFRTANSTGGWVGMYDMATNKIDFSAPMPGTNETNAEYQARWARIKAKTPKLYRDYNINPRGYDVIQRIGEPIDRSHYLYFMEPSRALFRRPELGDDVFMREATDIEFIEFLRHMIAKTERQAEEKRRARDVARAVAEVERPRTQLVYKPAMGGGGGGGAAAAAAPAAQKAKGRRIEDMRIEAFANGDIDSEQDLFTVFKFKGKEYWRKEFDNLLWEKDGDKLGNWAGRYVGYTDSIQSMAEPRLEYDGTPTQAERELFEKAIVDEEPKPKAELVMAPPVPSVATMAAAGGAGGGGSVIGRNMAARKIVSAPISKGEDETLGEFTHAGKRFVYSGMNEVWEYQGGGELGKWVGILVNDVMTKAQEPSFSE